jgi:hypothetical protein
MEGSLFIVTALRTSDLPTLKMDAVRSSKMSLMIYQTTWCHIPEDSNHISFLISCQIFLLFSISSSTWQNHLVLGHPIGLFPLNCNSNALLSILVLCIVTVVHKF